MQLKQIQTQLREPTERGRLYYYRDPEIEKNIVYIQNNIRRRPSYFINISCLAILDIDNYHLLKGVEIIYPQRAWSIDSSPRVIKDFFAADITFPALAVRTTYIELPVEVMTDHQKSYACVSIGQLDEETKWVALSNHCFALIKETMLQGFFIALGRPEVESNPKFIEE
jgi:hypothetical protein